LGAGLELEACGAGYLVNDCFAEPEQSLRSGDIIVAIERRLLVDLSEDEVEENFGAEFVDGASLVVGTFEELQHFSLQSISRRASDIVNMSAPSEGGAVQGERPTKSSTVEEIAARQASASQAAVSEGPETHEPIQLTVEMETSIAAPKTAAASTKETTTQPVDAEIFTETARPRGFGRGKNGLRSTATESKENSRYRMKETKETKERNGDAGDKETKKAPKGADSISRSDEKKSYYQPLPAKGSGGRGSGQRIWRPKV